MIKEENRCGCSQHGNSITHRPDSSTQPDKSSATFQTRWYIQAMDCPTEVNLIQRALAKEAGVITLEFNLVERVLTLHHDLSDLDPIRQKIEQLGMRVLPYPAQASSTAHPVAPKKKARWLCFGLSGMFAVAAEASVWIPWSYAATMSVILALLSIALGGLGTLKKGWIAVRHGALNIHFLMSVAVLGALAIGQWPEAAMVLFLFSLAERLEAMSFSRVEGVVRSLMSLTPEVAWVKKEGNWQALAPEKVTLGDIVRVRPGERVPLDGVLTKGYSAFNEAPITGESLPVEKASGDMVFAGCVNGSRVVEIQITALANDTLLARIVNLVREAKPAPMQRFIDRLAQIYTPTVLLLAVAFAILMPLLGFYTWHEAIYNALVMLVIACPCALVIATPVTVVSALAGAAKRGILIKGGEALEKAAHLQTVCFDKTGTLTLGQLHVASVIVKEGYTTHQILCWAAALEESSTHPIAHALVAEYRRQTPALSKLSASSIEEIPGCGIKGQIGEKELALGKIDWLQQAGQIDANLQTQAITQAAMGRVVLALRQGTQVVGLFALEDQIRPEAQSIIHQMQQVNLRVVMLSGDSQTAVNHIAQQLGIKEAYGALLPQDKLDHITRLQTLGCVAMVGDGVNDAPALAQADLGIAISGMSSDSALETADVILMENKLTKLMEVLAVSKTTQAYLMANCGIAIGIKVLFFVLAFFGLSTLWMAVFADVGASLIVIINGMRLIRLTPNTASNK